MLIELLADAGWFIYPLGACSFLSIYIMVDRWVALRSSQINGSGDQHLLGRILKKKEDPQANDEVLQAYAQLEVNRLEKGLFILDICASAAPLIGLLGTVTGLVGVFGNFDFSGNTESSSVFAEGVALALTTTMLGIVVALPSLIGSAFFSRRIEAISYQINVAIRENSSSKL